MAASIPLLVDDREPVDAALRLNSYGGIDATVQRNDFCDYLFFPHGKICGIERKTISDLLGSMASKRLVEQMHRLVKETDIGFLLREGSFKRSGGGKISYYSPRDPRANGDWVETGWDWNSFQGKMLDIQLLGVHIVDCPIVGDYPQEIARMVINLSKEEHKWLKERQRPEVFTNDSQYENAVWSLCALRGMGPETAEVLLREAGSLYGAYRLLGEDPERVASVKLSKRSIGKKTALVFQEEVMQQW